MILQFGICNQAKNVFILVSNHLKIKLEDISCPIYKNLRIGYRRMISEQFNRKMDIHTDQINYVTDFIEARRLRHFFSGDSLLDDKEQSRVIEDEIDPDAQEKFEKLKVAQERMHHLSPEHGTLFNLIITDVFILPSEIARAGSTSNAVGIIWASPKLNYAIEDCVEILVHEMTHHLMFLDEMRYLHYHQDAILNRKTWAKSAILNTARPLDKVLHSLVVALEVLLFREHFLGHPKEPKIHPPSQKILRQVMATIESLENVNQSFNSEIFYPRAVEIIHHSKTIANKMANKLLH